MAVGLCAVCVILFSRQAMEAAARAAETFFLGVLPALFPMMVLTSLLPSGGRAWKAAAFSLLSGSPASVRRAACAETAYPETLLALTGVMSPLFFTGTLAGWTGDAPSARKLLLLHWLGAAITAAVWRCFERPSAPVALPKGEKTALPAAIGQSVTAVLSVCGAMMLFSIAAAILRAALPLGEKPLALMHALLEIGSGARELLDVWEKPPYAWFAVTCAFGGLSIWLQDLLFLPQSIRPAKLLWMRALHGAVCGGLALISFP